VRLHIIISPPTDDNKQRKPKNRRKIENINRTILVWNAIWCGLFFALLTYILSFYCMAFCMYILTNWFFDEELEEITLGFQYFTMKCFLNFYIHNSNSEINSVWVILPVKCFKRSPFKLFIIFRKIIGVVDGLIPLHSPYQFQTNYYYGYYPTMSCKWLFNGYLRKWRFGWNIESVVRLFPVLLVNLK